MLFPNKTSIKLLKRILKAWIKFTPSLYIIIALIFPNYLYSKYKYITPPTITTSIAYGISYLNKNNLNQKSDFNHINFDIKTNRIPYLSLKGILLYSINAQFSNNIFKNNKEFSYSRYSLNISSFESFVKSITVHPLIGLSYVKIDFSNNNNQNPLSLASFNLNLGAGFDLRLQLFEDDDNKYNLLNSLNLKYSIMSSKIYYSDNLATSLNTSTFEIELSISFEIQKKEKN